MSKETNDKNSTKPMTYNALLTPVIQEAILNDEGISKLMKQLNRLYLTAMPIGTKHHDGQVIFKYSDEVNKADAQIKELIEERKNQIIHNYRYAIHNGR